MKIDSKSVGLILHPLSFEDVSVGIGYSAFSVDLICLPIAFADTIVGKCLYAFSLSFAKDPFAEVGGSGSEGDKRECFLVLGLHLCLDDVKERIFFM